MKKKTVLLYSEKYVMYKIIMLNKTKNIFIAEL